MSGSTRGKLREELQGMHTNIDWIIHHCQKSVMLIGDKKPELSEGIKSIADIAKTLDDLLMNLYSKL